MKKLISMMVVFGLITSQLACAGKVTKISAPLDQVKFEKEYRYSVKMKTGEQSGEIAGDQIQTKPNQLILNSNSQSKTLLTQDIEQVKGESTVRNGSQALAGLGYGAAIGGGFGALMGVSFVNSFCPDGNCGDRSFGNYASGALVFGAIFALPAAVVGLGIGALIPKYNKVQITPIVSPTAQGGLDAGVNVGVKF